MATFIDWWGKLNHALRDRNEPEALFGEAKGWFKYRPNWRNLEPSEPRIINRVVNARPHSPICSCAACVSANPYIA